MQRRRPMLASPVAGFESRSGVFWFSSCGSISLQLSKGGHVTMYKKLFIPVFALLLLLPVAEAVAQTAQKKKSAAKPAVNCREQARASCPGYGVSAQACFRAAMARCR